jgi:hypothetical protein
MPAAVVAAVELRFVVALVVAKDTLKSLTSLSAASMLVIDVKIMLIVGRWLPLIS